MASFPISIVAPTDPTAGSLVTNPGHAEEHQSHNAEIVAVETKLGTGSSTPAAGKVLRSTGSGISSWGGLDITTDVLAFTSASLRAVLSDETGSGAAVFGTSPTIATPAISNPTISSGGTWTGSPVLTTPGIVTSINDTNGNEIIKTPATASAVNELTITNAATGTSPDISATGGDTNISLTVTPKGTGVFKLPAGKTAGLVRSRQGGSSSDVTTEGTTTYDTSGDPIFIQTGTKLIDANPKTITFPTAFTQKPQLFVQVITQVGANCYAITPSSGITTTTCTIGVITDSGVANTGQTVFWMAIGKA